MLNTKTQKLPAQSAVFQTVPTERSHPNAVLRFHEALNVIEGRDNVHTKHLHAARHAVEHHLAETTDAEEKATSHYYLLRILLAERIFRENPRAAKLYHQMHAAFRTVEKSYLQEYRDANNKLEREVIKKQLGAFYQLVDGYLRSLEVIYEEKGLHGAHERVHEDKMRFRRRSAKFDGRHLRHAGHLFLEHTSRYGHSFSRWGVTVAIFILLFAGIFAVLDYLNPVGMFDMIATFNPFDYVYFSIVSFTTVGYGDIVPITNLEKLLSGVEALLGYLMLGVFITLIQKRL